MNKRGRRDTLLMAYLQKMGRFVSQCKQRSGDIVPFFSMVNRRKKIHAEVMQAFHEHHPDCPDTFIP